MTEPKGKTRVGPKPQRAASHSTARSYEVDTVALRSLKLIAAPDPKDDLSDEELVAFCQDPRNSSLVRHLIEYVKAM